MRVKQTLFFCLAVASYVTGTFTMRFISDYVQWRRWDQAVVFVPPTGGEELSSIVATLGSNGVSTGLEPLDDPHLPDATEVTRHRLGCVVFLRHQGADDLLDLMSQKQQFNSYLSWLLIAGTSSEDEVLAIREHLSVLSIGPDSDVIVATLNKTCSISDNTRVKCAFSYNLDEVHKLRAKLNTSLVVERLGAWSTTTRTTLLATPSDAERRVDMRGFPLVVGIKQAGIDDGGDASLDDFGEDIDKEILMEILDSLSGSLNASIELVGFSKLGWRNEEGAWLYLLGAVNHGDVDLGLELVSVTAERAKDIGFSLPLAQSMRNIYFRRPETAAMRDIFLAPFSSRLLACVVTTGAVLGLAVVVVNAVHPSGSPSEHVRWGAGEALVWSISVLCMQGSPWNPTTPSGSVVLIMSLVFALVVYNAYAAFITSVLSVHTTSIKSLDDLLSSDLQFGYTSTTIPSSDDVFLRNSNDSTLRSLYYRGLLNNHGVSDAVEGMRRSSVGGYAFFVSSRIAHHAIGSYIAHEKRCDVQELSVETTRSVLALPVGLASPYRRLINLSLLRMKEAGVLGRIRQMVLPPMPSCQEQSTFNSARFTDVYSAFFMLGVGLLMGVLVGVAEGLWWQRGGIVKKMSLRNKCKRYKQRKGVSKIMGRRNVQLCGSVEKLSKYDTSTPPILPWHN